MATLRPMDTKLRRMSTISGQSGAAVLLGGDLRVGGPLLSPKRRPPPPVESREASARLPPDSTGGRGVGYPHEIPFRWTRLL